MISGTDRVPDYDQLLKSLKSYGLHSREEKPQRSTAPGCRAAPVSRARINTGTAVRIEDCVVLGLPGWNRRDAPQPAAGR